MAIVASSFSLFSVPGISAKLLLLLGLSTKHLNHQKVLNPQPLHKVNYCLNALNIE